MSEDLELVGYKCRKCGKMHYPFHDRCLACKNRDFEHVKPDGDARLLTFTRIYNLPWGFDQRYLTFGVVEFDNGIRALGQIDIDEAGDLNIGMVLIPTWDTIRVQHGENVKGLKLVPAN